ncbi:MAG: tetratricopeptide repeat protein [Verrucomicrobia bacterium]|nr:MAG: tetratricopeptide repeat protein [Verrucomicrobiota bacterium]
MRHRSTLQLLVIVGLLALCPGRTSSAPAQPPSAADTAAEAASLRDRLATNPADTEAAYRLARLLSDQGRPDEAIGVLQAGLAASPGDPTLRRALAMVAKIHGRTELAIATLSDLLEDFPDDRTAFNHLLDLYLQAGNEANAARCFDRLIAEGRITEADKHLFLADMHLNRGEFRPVPRLLGQARKAAPDHPNLDRL